MSAEQKQLSHVRYLWKDEEAAALRGLDRLVYRSNKLGEDLTLTNTGGGNTSSKLLERDPLTGKEVEASNSLRFRRAHRKRAVDERHNDHILRA